MSATPLTTHVKTEVAETIDKYSQRPTDATIIFSRNAHEFICDAVVHLSTGLNVQAKGASTEIYAAFDQCKERMDKQLRRYKRRLKDHHKDRAEPVAFEQAGMYVLAADEDEWEAQENGLQPLIIAEMETRRADPVGRRCGHASGIGRRHCWSSATRSTGA